MSYTVNFKEERYAPIKHAIESLEGLQVGDRVVMEEVDLTQIGTIKYLLYDWLYHKGLKTMFKVGSNLSRREIWVERRLPIGAMRIRKETTNQRLLEELIISEEPEKLVGKWVEKKEITETQGERLLDNLSKILE